LIDKDLTIVLSEMLVAVITKEHKKERNLTVLTGMSFLLSKSILARFMPQRMPKQMPIMITVAK
jgi:hypothetical protein